MIFIFHAELLKQLIMHPCMAPEIDLTEAISKKGIDVHKNIHGISWGIVSEDKNTCSSIGSGFNS